MGNLPNILTFARLLLVPVFVALLLRDAYLPALVVFVVAGLTDGLDGFLARRLNLQTPLGALLDPLADKALLLGAFLTLAAHDAPVRLPARVVGVLILRDVVVLAAAAALFRRAPRESFYPSRWGKMTTVLQILLVAVALLDNLRGQEGSLLVPLAGLALLASVVSGSQYLVRALRLLGLGGSTAPPAASPPAQ